MAELDAVLEAGDEEVDRAPVFLTVEVANGEPLEEVTFDLYGTGGPWVGLLTELLDEDGLLSAPVPIPAVPAGSYTLQVIGTVSTNTSVDFTVIGEPLDGSEDPVSTPVLPVGNASHRWQFVDTSVGSTYSYTMPRNPSSWTNPNRPANIDHDVTTAPDGNVLAWEGAERSWTFDFSGYIDTQAEYEALEFWANLRRRFWLIDHRNRARYVTFEHFDANARIVPNKPWAHDYTMRVVHFYRQDLSGQSEGE